MGRADRKQTLTFHGINRNPVQSTPPHDDSSTNTEALVAVKSIQPLQSTSSTNEAAAISTGFQFPKTSAKPTPSSSSTRKRFKRLNLSDLTEPTTGPSAHTPALPSMSTLSELFDKQTQLHEDNLKENDGSDDGVMNVEVDGSWLQYEVESDIRPQRATFKLSKKERAGLRRSNFNKHTTTSNELTSRRDNRLRSKATTDKLGDIGVNLAQQAGLRSSYPDINWSNRNLFIPSVARRYGYSFTGITGTMTQPDNSATSKRVEETLQKVNQKGLGGPRSTTAEVMLGLLMKGKVGLYYRGELFIYEEGKRWDRQVEETRNKMRDVLAGLTGLSMGSDG